MVQGYYTLEEAAKILGMEADKLGQMAQRREIRAFADRGTWRFRTQDVEELGRQMGIGSDPELQMGEHSSSKSSGKLPKVKAKKTTDGDDLFEFELSGSSDELSIELDDPGAVRKKTNLAGGGKDKKTNLGEEGDALRSPSVEDAPIGFLDDPGRSSSKLRGKTGSGKVKTGTSDPDSGLKLVPMDDDGIPITQDFSGGKDSDLKLDPASDSGSDQGDLPPTEEVRLDDLDLELETPSSKKSSGKLGGPSSKAGMGSAASPFELSEDDLDLDADTKKMTKVGGGGGGRKMTQSAPPPSDDDDEVSLGDLTLGDGDFSGASGASGINLHLPADTGINLERAASGGDDEVEFELSLDSEGDDLVTGPATSKKLDGTDAGETPSSESEFELTLGDDGDLAPLEDGAEASSDSTEVAEEKDIFETDFDIPALDDESGSAAVALEESDTDLESSDFEFDATASEEELEDSGSQVMAIDDEEDDSKSQVVAIDEEEEVVEEEDELAGITDGEEEEEEEEEEAVAVAGAALPPAPWGALPTIFMLPCVVVMGLLGLMTFEMLHGMWGYRQSHPTATLLIKPVSELFGADLPKD
jgi:excisionase family DNA binding protein